MNSQIEQIIRQTLAGLSAHQVETSAYEIKLLLAEVLGCNAGSVLSYPRGLTERQLRQFEEFVALRRRHVPADKIIGHRGFYKYEFAVNSDVLSPRPDTEVLVEAAIRGALAENSRTVLELGVGSGCVILSVLADCPQLSGTGVDISDAALAVARRNAETMGLAQRLDLRRSDWFAADFAAQFASGFDMVVSNPPYIARKEILSLDAEVRDYDPRAALDGGEDGLDSYRRIAALAPQLLNEGGRIYLEVGESQAREVSALFAANGLTPEKILKDLGGVERCVILKK